MSGVLITGGFGFVGTHVATHLIRQDIPVTIADIRSRPSGTTPLDTVRGQGNVTAITCDIARPEHADRLLASRRFDHVLHLAGVATIEAAAEAPGETLSTNVSGTTNVLRACLKHQHSLRSFSMLSSDKIYGLVDPNEGPATESTAPRPYGVYGQSLWMAEQAVETLRFAADFPITVLRTGNIVGAWDHSPTRLMPSAGRRLFDKHPQPPVLHEQSEQHLRYFLDISDVVQAWDLVTELTDGGVFNLVPQQALRVSAVLEMLVEVAANEVAGFSPRRAAWIRENGVSRRMAPKTVAAAAPPGCFVSGDRLTSLTGFAPKVSLQESLCRYVSGRMGSSGSAPPVPITKRRRAAATPLVRRRPDKNRKEKLRGSAANSPRWARPEDSFIGPFSAAAADRAAPGRF